MVPNIILLGPAGAGKSALVEQLVSYKNYHPISLGKILRSENFLRTPLGGRLIRFLNAGMLIDDFTANTILFSLIQQVPTAKPFVIDGYPRNLQQAKRLKAFTVESKISIDLIVELDLPLKRASERIRYQAIEDKSKEVDPVGYHPEIRSDDFVVKDHTYEAIRNRFLSYKAEIKGIRMEFEDWGKFTVIDADKPLEEVTDALFAQVSRDDANFQLKYKVQRCLATDGKATVES